MFNIGFSEMLVIAILALILIGPKQLPEVARTIGRFLNELRRSSDAIKDEFVKSSKEIIDQAKVDQAQGQNNDQTTNQISNQPIHPDQIQANFEKPVKDNPAGDAVVHEKKDDKRS